MNQSTLHTIADLKAFSTENAQQALELGQILYMPNYSLALTPGENRIYDEVLLDGKHKNVSYSALNQKLGGLSSSLSSDFFKLTQSFMQRFADYSKKLIDCVLPYYSTSVEWGRTSYRPAEIKGRAYSERKDDTRLHVDAFPASPVQGKRILRVFCNINPSGIGRVWQTGEPFEIVLNQFLPRLPRYRPQVARLLKFIGATKTLRTEYDHYMLHLHDQMKMDNSYQNHVQKETIEFPAYSTWIVFTDSVSHAALSGSHLLEQTFYLDVNQMKEPKLAPFSILNRSLK
jgi:hypothetical protein